MVRERTRSVRGFQRRGMPVERSYDARGMPVVAQGIKGVFCWLAGRLVTIKRVRLL